MICNKCQKEIQGEYVTKISQSDLLQSEVYHYECVRDVEPEPLKINLSEYMGAKGRLK
jgi:hypothetical protein